MIDQQAKIYVAGHTGLAGSAITRKLKALGFHNLLLTTSQTLDLTQQHLVKAFFEKEKPDYVFLCAAKVGGILANKNYPALFIQQNLMIQTNVIHAAKEQGVKRLLFLGSSCIYPRNCPQPMKEDYLLTGPLEFTNRPYAIAKIAGIEMCWAYNRQYNTRFLCAMPTNLYGPGDHYDLENSHVLPAMLRKFHEAKEQQKKGVELWGTGQVRREFLHSDDLADAAIRLMTLSESAYNALLSHPEQPPVINVGTGQDLTIRELADMIQKIVGFEGDVEWNRDKPDGTPQKLLDVSRLSQMGWKSKIPLEKGIQDTYQQIKTTKTQSTQRNENGERS